MSDLSSLPANWIAPEIGDVCEIVAGYGFPPELQGRDQGDLPFFKVGDISEAWQRNERYLIQAKHYISHDEARNINARPLCPGTVVFAKIGAAIALNRRALLTVPSLVDNNCMGILSDDAIIDQHYLFYFTCTLRLGDSSRASIVPSLRKSDVSTIRLPLPPLTEQRRIVAKIEELFSDLDAGVAALERVRANLKRYRAAVLKAAVEGKLTEDWRAQHPDTEPASVLLERILTERRRQWDKDQLAKFAQAGKQPPKGWEAKYPNPAEPQRIDTTGLPPAWCWAGIEQLNSSLRPISYGVLQPGGDVEGGIPFIRVCDVVEGKILVDQLKHIDPGISAQYQRTILQGGEVLLTVVGTIGRTAIVPDSLRGANTARAVSVIPLQGAVDGRFFELTLRESSMRTRLTQSAHEVARKTLNLEDVRIACIPFPPLDEQAEIVAEVERRLSVVEEIEAEVGANLKRAARLRQGILKRAFEGRLVPQDPNDEPAEQLLARIRAGRQARPSANGKPRTPRRGRTRKDESARPLLTRMEGAPEGGEP